MYLAFHPVRQMEWLILWKLSKSLTKCESLYVQKNPTILCSLFGSASSNADEVAQDMESNGTVDNVTTHVYKRMISGAVYLQQPNAWDKAHMSCYSYILTRMAMSKFNIFRIGNKVWTKTCTNKNMRMPGTFPRDASCCRHGSSSNSKRKLLASFNNASTFSFRKHQNHPLALLNLL